MRRPVTVHPWLKQASDKVCYPTFRPPTASSGETPDNPNLSPPVLRFHNQRSTPGPGDGRNLNGQDGETGQSRPDNLIQGVINVEEETVRESFDRYGTRMHDMRVVGVKLPVWRWKALVRRLRREVEDSGTYESIREAVELAESIQSQLD